MRAIGERGAGPGIESEAKFRIRDAAGLRQRLRALGFRVTGRRTFQQNWIWDDAQGSLRRAGRVLRLRRSGRQWRLTAKGPRLAGAIKRRREEEMAVADGPQVLRLLALAGLRPVLTYARWRTRFQRPGESGELDWDETPVGVYLELEGRPAWVRRTAAELGLQLAKAERRSYAEIYGR